MLGKLPVKLFAETREISESVAVSGAKGAILTRRALRSTREMYTSVPHISENMAATY